MIGPRSQRFVILSFLCAFIALISNVAGATPVTTWKNETGDPSEADFVLLTSPSTLGIVNAGATSALILGQIFEAVLTAPGGANASVSADVGYGAAGSDPTTDSSWIWTAAFFNTQAGNDDFYNGQFVFPLINGNYRYTIRFSVDSGATFTAADLDGAGSAVPGLTFDPLKLGTFTVINGTDPVGAVATPEPATLVLVGLGGLIAARRRRRK